MLKLRKLHLDLAFVALGALGENIQDEAGAINDPYLQMPLKITLLGRRQGVVEDDDVDLLAHDGISHFSSLARPNEQGGIRTRTPPCDRYDRFRSRGFGKQGKFFQTSGKITLAEIDAD
jgi:hypothetical protein